MQRTKQTESLITRQGDSRTQGLGDQAYNALREAIQEGRITPGQRILEVEICAWLKISRTPVREALRRLCNQGLLESAPGGGLAVVTYDLRAISELYDIREPFEGTAAALAAQNADETEIRILKALVIAHRQLPPDPEVHFRKNKEFHDHIYRAAHNRFLWNVLHDLHDAVALLGRTTFQTPGRIDIALSEHDEIAAAIAERSPERAEAAMRKHVRNGYLARINAITRNVGADAHAELPPPLSPRKPRAESVRRKAGSPA